MDINIMAIVVLIIIAGLAWYANEMLNKVPVLNTVVKVLIVVISVLLLLQYTGLLGSLDTHVRVN